jgi:hypothetical protein
MNRISSRLAQTRSVVTVAVLAVFVGLIAYAEESISGDKALEMLRAGNTRYVSGKLKPKDYAAERPELAGGQHPYAIVPSGARTTPGNRGSAS